jgi:short-subunit dehydrogenase
MSHFLVIGGTGMLADAVLAWNQQGHTVTVVARTEEKLKRLVSRATFPEQLHIVQSDYLQFEKFTNQLAQLSIPDVIVSWIHRSGNDTVQWLCNHISDKRIAFFHIKGSSAHHPQQNFIPQYSKSISYHEVILGFQLDNDVSRWLTNAEIAAGVVHAAEQKLPKYIVGTVEPWDARP